MIDLLELPWLRRKSAEAGVILADRSALGELPLGELARLAQFRLGDAEVRRLARAAGLRRAEAEEAALSPLRVCLASQTTANFLADELVAAGLRFGLSLDVVATEYNQLAELAYGSFFAQQDRVDFTFVGLDYRQLGLRDDVIGDGAAAEAEADEKLASIRSLCNGIRSKSGAPCIVQNIVPQPREWAGSLDRALPGSMRWFVDRLNSGIRDYVAEQGNYLFDAEYLAADVGLANWHDASMWYLAKLGISPKAVPLFANRLAALLAAARGKSRRVLVLDLDNTLWGGVIGDDGVEGIRIGQGSAAGEAFLDVQRMALQLKSRGVVLAVSSKNDDAVARLAFERHAGMALKHEDFAVFRANWDDKASNIRHIAHLLNLSLDSFVAVDDNPAERDIIRRTLPDVAVPELGDNPADYARIVMAAGYFEQAAFSVEDRRRAQMYRDNAARTGAMEIVADMEAYLASLEMRIRLRPFDRPGRARIVQLINKSNQFNLTTKRYTEAEVEALEEGGAVLTLQASLADKFGDNGMISVVICRPDAPGAWVIDTWLMSCRVLKRRVEDQVLQYIVARARDAGISRLKGLYRPTKKNGLVQYHYRDLGFERDPRSTEDEQIWMLQIGSVSDPDPPLPFELM